MPALQRVNSIDFAQGDPWDFMHLLFENIVKNLISMWKEKFKGLNAGSQNFIIPEHIWEVIGQKMVAATRDIPAAFIISLSNIADD